MHRGKRIYWILGALFILAGIGVGMLLTNIQQRKSEGLMYPLRIVEVAQDEIDPEIWGRNFPFQYDSFRRTEIDSGRTKYGGSTPFDKLAANPFKRKAWAGYPFEVEYNNARGHFYAQIDQRKTLRTQKFEQPAACLHCHAAEAPLLIAEFGWEDFHKRSYNDLKDRVHLGTSCADCHAPETMELRITRPAFRLAMEERGVDLTQATRQEMRSYVCAQCHVEYYFRGPDRILTFPWTRGFTVDDIEAHYDEYGFTDWRHGLTEAPMLKMQHPEFELYTTGIHARSGVSCADCHMPYTREGGVKVSDHWIRSPLMNVNNACQTCHKIPEQEIVARVVHIQDRTHELLKRTESAISEAIDAIVQAQQSGAADESLQRARQLHRRAQMRWDFVVSENSMGFHSPQEAARVLAAAIDFARQAQLEAVLSRR